MRAKFVTFLCALSFLCILPLSTACALDFDQDGYDDFVLIDINQNQNLEWYAIDLNDTQRRYLGQHGETGNHLAVGNWFGNNSPSVALIRKNSNGKLEWDVSYSAGTKSINLGNSGSKVISGLDYDNNNAIDPTTVSNTANSLSWSVLSNPALSNSTTPNEVAFGGVNALPFFANPDGKGDQIAVASVSSKGMLTLRYRNLTTGKVRTRKVNNIKTNITSVLPAKLPTGQDAIFTVSKNGSIFEVTLIIDNKKIKTIKVKGDEAVVGKYLGGKTELLAIRTASNKALLIYPNGNKRKIAINLSGILVDDININSFSSDTAAPPAENPTKGGSNPVCVGTADSRQHLLYKPVSDTMGTAVLVFDSKYKKEFRAVKIELKDGTFAEGWWKTLVLWGNPDAGGMRQHWRTNVKASEVKDNALVIVDDTNQECRFQLPGSSRTRWE